jgi:hypothetical protein
LATPPPLLLYQLALALALLLPLQPLFQAQPSATKPFGRKPKHHHHQLTFTTPTATATAAAHLFLAAILIAAA